MKDSVLIAPQPSVQVARRRPQKESSSEFSQRRSSIRLHNQVSGKRYDGRPSNLSVNRTIPALPSPPIQLDQLDDHHEDLDNLIQSLCQQGHLDRALQALSYMDLVPSIDTYMYLLKSCKKGCSYHVKQIYAHVKKNRALLSGLLGGYLVMTLARCGAIDDAIHVSTNLPDRTVYSWTALITAYSDSGQALEALELYQLMLKDGVEPNSYTFVSLFKSCGILSNLAQGKKLHDDAYKRGLVSVVFVANSLITMYGKCGAVMEAEEVFIQMSARTIITWTAMICVYVEKEQGEKALRLYRQMVEDGCCPNEQTFVATLQACAVLAQQIKLPLEICEGIHADAHMKHFQSDVFVVNSLLKVFAKCGNITAAEHVFQSLSCCDIVSWNTLISAYVEHGQAKRALHLYTKLHEEGAHPDRITYMGVFHACGMLAENKDRTNISAQMLEVGMALHGDACRNCASDMMFDTALLGMYGKCGATVEAEEIFNELDKTDIVSWNAMFSAYVDAGQGERALFLYECLQRETICANVVTYVCILQACSKVGSLEMCQKLHFDIVSSAFDNIPCIATSLINAYGSCVSMPNAWMVFDGMPSPDAMAWTACLSGITSVGNTSQSLNTFEELKFEGIIACEVCFIPALLACSHSGQVAKGLELFSSMNKDFGIVPGIKHYSVMLDSFGRAGDVMRVESILRMAPEEHVVGLWLSLLGACQAHGNLGFAEAVFDHAVSRECTDSTLYVLMSNMYVDSE